MALGASQINPTYSAHLRAFLKGCCATCDRLFQRHSVAFWSCFCRFCRGRLWHSAPFCFHLQFKLQLGYARLFCACRACLKDVSCSQTEIQCHAKWVWSCFRMMSLGFIVVIDTARSCKVSIFGESMFLQSCLASGLWRQGWQSCWQERTQF